MREPGNRSGTVCDDSMDAEQVVRVAPVEPDDAVRVARSGCRVRPADEPVALVTDCTPASGPTSSMAFCVAVTSPGVRIDRPNAVDRLRRGDTVASSAPGTGRVGPLLVGGCPPSHNRGSRQCFGG
jgi:hypothetical protein